MEKKRLEPTLELQRVAALPYNPYFQEEMKKVVEVSPPFGWRAWLALIDEDPECYRAQRQLLTTRGHGYIIGDKSNAGQDVSL